MSSQRRATISDVAQAAGVSRTTVSYVLSGRQDARVPDGTRRRILDAAEHVGYRRNALAVAFRSGRMNTIGIVAPFSLTSAAELSGGVYYKDLILALAAAGFTAGMNTTLLSEGPSEELSLRDITDRRADGVIIVGKANPTAFAQAAEEAGVPCVMVGRNVGPWQVHADNRIGARQAVAHLLSLGHRRIAYLWYGHEHVPSAYQRREGFREAMQEAGLGGTSAWELRDKDRKSLADLLREPDGPTAVFCYNDELGVWLLDVARDAGLRVPEDLSVVGFDDNILAHTTRPRLTSVHAPLDRMATAAVELIQAQLRGEEPPPGPVLVEPWLVVRESTDPPRTESINTQ